MRHSNPHAGRPVLAVRGGPPVSSSPVPMFSLALTDADVAAATAVLRSGMLRQGDRCAELESRFAGMSEARFALTCANGTCALQLAYAALFEPGCDVLVPDFSFVATASMVVAAGCRPVFCDIRPDTFQIDVDDAVQRLTDRTGAIVATHLYGCPVDIDAVQQLAAQRQLRVVYDAAQAHLARYRGRGIGAFGDAVTYSLYATKNLATGEGGLVTTNDASTAAQIALLRSHGETERYVHEQIGFNFRLNDIAAAIGCSRLDRLAEQTASRRQAARRYDALLSRFEEIQRPAVTDGAEPVWHLYTCVLDTEALGVTRDEFCAALRAEGVPTAVHYPRPISAQPAMQRFAADPPPRAREVAQRVFSLPMHHDLTEEHFDIISRALEKVLVALRGRSRVAVVEVPRPRAPRPGTVQ